MSEIKRYATRVADGGVVGMIEDEDGGWVMYTDHVAALKAARNELPDVGSWSPERKFKIGNQVTHRDSKKVRKIKNYYFSSEDNEWKYDIGFYYVESELTLYIAPTPAELIPTLVDRVRDMKHACIQAVQYVLDDYEEYEVTTKEIKFAILEMLRNTQVTYDEPETEVKR